MGRVGKSRGMRGGKRTWSLPEFWDFLEFPTFPGLFFLGFAPGSLWDIPGQVRGENWDPPVPKFLKLRPQSQISIPNSQSSKFPSPIPPFPNLLPYSQNSKTSSSILNHIPQSPSPIPKFLFPKSPSQIHRSLSRGNSELSRPYCSGKRPPQKTPNPQNSMDSSKVHGFVQRMASIRNPPSPKKTPKFHGFFEIPWIPRKRRGGKIFQKNSNLTFGKRGQEGTRNPPPFPKFFFWGGEWLSPGATSGCPQAPPPREAKPAKEGTHSQRRSRWKSKSRESREYREFREFFPRQQQSASHPLPPPLSPPCPAPYCDRIPGNSELEPGVSRWDLGFFWDYFGVFFFGRSGTGGGIGAGILVQETLPMHGIPEGMENSRLEKFPGRISGI